MDIFRVLLVLLVITLLLVVGAHDPIVIVSNPAHANPSVCEGDYTLEANDTLGSIATRCAVSTAEMLLDNPHCKDAHSVHPGDTIHLPGKGKFPGDAETCPQCSAQDQSQPALVIDDSSLREHVVRQGDTLDAIASRYDVTVEAIRAENLSLASTDRLVWGQVLIIPYQ